MMIVLSSREHCDGWQCGRAGAADGWQCQVVDKGNVRKRRSLRDGSELEGQAKP